MLGSEIEYRDEAQVCKADSKAGGPVLEWAKKRKTYQMNEEP